MRHILRCGACSHHPKQRETGKHKTLKYILERFHCVLLLLPIDLYGVTTPLSVERCDHNVAAWRGTDKIEWITGHKRERRFVLRLKRRQIGRISYPNLVHGVDIHSRCRDQLNGVSLADIFQTSKESISVSGNYDVSTLSREGTA